jgi:protein disulfide-isomerase A6
MPLRASLLCLAAAFCFVAAVQAEYLEIGPDDFDKVVNGEKNVLVCVYDSNDRLRLSRGTLQDVDRASEVFPLKGDTIIAAFDGDVAKDVVGRFGITDFPVMLFFPKGMDSTGFPEWFDQSTAAWSIVEFLNEKTGSNKELAEIPDYVAVLDSGNFSDVVKDRTKDVLVEFYAPWCGHCKQLAEPYKQTARAFARDDDVVIAKVNVVDTAVDNKDLAKEYGITGFPTLKFFGKKSKNVGEPCRARSKGDLVEFINEKTGKHRRPDGRLGPEAGRTEKLDDLAAKFKAASDQSEREAVIKETEALAHSDEYTWVMHECAHHGPEWFGEEIARIDDVIDDDKISDEERDSASVRRNVLKAF